MTVNDIAAVIAIIVLVYSLGITYSVHALGVKYREGITAMNGASTLLFCYCAFIWIYVWSLSSGPSTVAQSHTLSTMSQRLATDVGSGVNSTIGEELERIKS